jgi:hypothetical protein
MAATRRTHGGARRAGFVYLIALLAVTVAGAIAMVMGRGAGMRLQAGNAVTARADCRAAALGMLRAVVSDLNASLLLGLPELTTVQPGGEQIGDCTVVLIGRDPQGVTASFGLVPEAGKYPINVVPANAQGLNDEYNLLTALPGMTSDVAGALLDWVDSDDVVNAYGGAERTDPTYAGAAVPYAPRNAPFETMAELRMVRGVTDGLYFGEDANGNGVLDAGEDTDRDGKLTPGLRDLFTLMAIREPPLAPDGSQRVAVTGSWARAKTAVQNLISAILPGREADLIGEADKAVGPGGFANRLEFFASLTLTDAEAALLWANTQDGNNRVGLIDAWSCRSELLNAVVTSDIAAKIIAARPTTMPSGPGWLTSTLTPGEARLCGQLTSGSYQFTADLLAVRNDGSGWARLAATINCNSGTAVVETLQPLEIQGWPLPWVAPAQLRGSDPATIPTLLTAAPH